VRNKPIARQALAACSFNPRLNSRQLAPRLLFSLHLRLTPIHMSSEPHEQDQPPYFAFISYSQRDRKMAAWLHRALETYRVPKQLVGTTIAGQTIPGRLFPVFRDREELAGASSLGDALSGVLKRSSSLIVVCSPNAARSRRVNEEIKTYRAFGRSDRVFAVIAQGEPNVSSEPERISEECLPEALRDSGLEPIAGGSASGQGW